MIVKYSDSNNVQQNFQVINEVLELYRFIVEKYASFNVVDPNGQISSNITIICELALFLDGFWDRYAATLNRDGGDSEERERSLIISSIMRIMTQTLSKMPFSDLPAESVISVLKIAFKQANQGVVLA
jgi:hypothetical protein